MGLIIFGFSSGFLYFLSKNTTNTTRIITIGGIMNHNFDIFFAGIHTPKEHFSLAKQATSSGQLSQFSSVSMISFPHSGV